MRKRYHYYKIAASDVAQFKEAYGDNEATTNALIDYCRERANLYILLCTWRVWYHSDESATVRRVSNRPAKESAHEL